MNKKIIILVGLSISILIVISIVLVLIRSKQSNNSLYYSTVEQSKNQKLSPVGNTKQGITSSQQPQITTTREFLFEPYDKVFGTTGPKAILYITVQAGPDTINVNTFPYLKSLAEKGLIQIAVRNIDTINFANLNTVATESEKAAAFEAIKGFPNCVKIISPKDYFPYISVLSKTYTGKGGNRLLGMDFTSVKDLVSLLEFNLPKTIDKEAIKKCVKDGNYESIIQKENDIEKGMQGAPVLIFPETHQIISGIFQSEKEAVDRLAPYIDTSKLNYKKESGKEKLNEILK